MGWQFTGSVDEFAEHVGPLLRQEPERHTIALTVVETVRAGFRWSDDPMHFCWWERDGDVRGAVWLTPPHPLGVAVLPPESIDDLVDLLCDITRVGAVNGERDDAAAFTSAWTGRVGGRTDVLVEQRLYRLETLLQPPHAPVGRPRRATPADLALIEQWFEDFTEEATPGGRADHRAILAQRVNDGLFWLWERDAVPVAMAGRQPPAAGVSRVGPVYTPPPQRKQGYGTAVTAACTQDALDTGARGVVLFTDLANPTSNAIYQTIGFRPVTDRIVIGVQPAG